MGLVQNMSFFKCPKCETSTHVFGHDGCVRIAKSLSVDILGDVPLHENVCATSDAGHPITLSNPSSLHANVFSSIATKIIEKISSSKDENSSTNI